MAAALLLLGPLGVAAGAAGAVESDELRLGVADVAVRHPDGRGPAAGVHGRRAAADPGRARLGLTRRSAGRRDLVVGGTGRRADVGA